ncbi:NB-ARC domain-containing protein [Streptomyces flavofungini]|uniref:NB-ARC domain-containing protein n=1 Tax=Streptomyces flavofungini TaxID=68200 RepID=UPI0027DE5675|nr:NB-ARC domain-containing protein [Streptomyces flavofungini]
MGETEQVPAGDPPPRSTAMVGRREELAQLKEACTRRPLVTVTGVGGVGKTRRARHAAVELESSFPDGVWWVELSPLHDGTLLGLAIAEALPLADQSTRPMLDVLREYLAERQSLLVLDTCEHLTEACAFAVEPLLRAAPGLWILATSRRPLGLLAEEVLSLEPLLVPETDDDGQAGHGDAVELLVRRAVEAGRTPPDHPRRQASRPGLDRSTGAEGRGARRPNGDPSRIRACLHPHPRDPVTGRRPRSLPGSPAVPGDSADSTAPSGRQRGRYVERSSRLPVDRQAEVRRASVAHRLHRLLVAPDELPAELLVDVGAGPGPPSTALLLCPAVTLTP